MTTYLIWFFACLGSSIIGTMLGYQTRELKVDKYLPASLFIACAIGVLAVCIIFVMLAVVTTDAVALDESLRGAQ